MLYGDIAIFFTFFNPKVAIMTHFAHNYVEKRGHLQNPVLKVTQNHNTFLGMKWTGRIIFGCTS